VEIIKAVRIQPYGMVATDSKRGWSMRLPATGVMIALLVVASYVAGSEPEPANAPAPSEVGVPTASHFRGPHYGEYCGGQATGTNQSCTVTFQERPVATIYVIYCTSTCGDGYRTTGHIRNFVDNTDAIGHARYVRSYSEGTPYVCTEYAFRPPNVYNRMHGSLLTDNGDRCELIPRGMWGVAVDFV
jgi:hypothetical protein